MKEKYLQHNIHLVQLMIILIQSIFMANESIFLESCCQMSCLSLTSCFYFHPFGYCPNKFPYKQIRKFISQHQIKQNLKQKLKIKIQSTLSYYFQPFHLFHFQHMDRQTLRSIIFQSKQMHKHNRARNKRSQLSYRKPEDKMGSICLLGSLELQKKLILPSQPAINKFQIVQLKKHKSSQQPRREESKYDTALKSEIKNREIRSHRQSFKVDKLEHSQLNMFEKSFGIKFAQNPNYLIENEVITNSRNNNEHRNTNTRKSERVDNFSHGKSSLNIEHLPEKFIPSIVLSSKEYKRIYEDQKRKIIEQRNQSLKKNIYLDFHSIKLNISDINDLKQLQKSAIIPSSNQNKPLPHPSSPQQINRATSSMTMSQVPRKNQLKRMFEQQKQFQDKIQMEKKQVLEIKRQVNKNYAKPFNPPQNISAQAYIVYEVTRREARYRRMSEGRGEKKRFQNGHKVLVELNSRTPVQIASLTKIMTFIVALEICKKYNKIQSEEVVKIGLFEQNITGTTANLCKGEVYTLEQLFYGLMLPSGNDASLAIAVWGGRTILQTAQTQLIDPEAPLARKKKLYYDRFIEQMNKKARELGMEKTNYANSHGLMNFDNKSCSFDLALLCEYAMKNDTFRLVVKTRSYECVIPSEKEDTSTIASPTLTNRSSSINIESEDAKEMKDFYADEKEQFQLQDQQSRQFEQSQNPQTFLQDQTSPSAVFLSLSQAQKPSAIMFTKRVFWQNTHFLVQQKSDLYKGIKTGITNTAGPCLASLVQHNQRQFIIIVLNCKTMKQRFKDTENLRKWAFQKEEIKMKE